MEVHLVSESIKFMILGMGIVFVFLYILVLLMRLQAWVIARYFPEEAARSGEVSPAADEDERARVAAIVAAVAEYRRSGGAKG